jgi:micrococcal nuclease
MPHDSIAMAHSPSESGLDASGRSLEGQTICMANVGRGIFDLFRPDTMRPQWRIAPLADGLSATRTAMAALALIALADNAHATPFDACEAPSGGPLTPITAQVKRVSGGATFIIDDGREVHLAGVEAPFNHLDEPAPSGSVDLPASADSTLENMIAGRQVTLYPVAGQPDRHGRLRARVLRVDGDLWVEPALVSLGLARVEPHPDDYGCARYLQSLETVARAGGKGIWADPRYSVHQATEPQLRVWTGRYILVEGKIVSTGQSGNRRYLNFGSNFSRDFAVVLDDKSGAPSRRGAARKPGRFATEGFESADIVGRTIRVRGVLMPGGGGLMVPSVPEEIEWVAEQP